MADHKYHKNRVYSNMPASKIGGGEIARAAAKRGLPTDNETLNKIVRQVNRGQTLAQAARSVADGRS